MNTFYQGLAIATLAIGMAIMATAASAAPPVPSNPASSGVEAQSANPLVEDIGYGRRGRCRWTEYGWIRWTKWGPVRCRPKFHPNIHFGGGFNLHPGPSHCVKKLTCDTYYGCRLVRYCY